MSRMEKINVGLSIITFLSMLISTVFLFGSWTTNVENRIFDTPAQKEQVIGHPKDKNIHKTTSEMETYFVTRREYLLLKEGQDEIKDMIRDLKK